MNPIIATRTRGAIVECVHRGACRAIGGSNADVLVDLGDTKRLLYPRSTIKLLQAIPLIESGAHARFGLSGEQLAIACGSHSSEDRQVRCVRSILDAAGFDENHLLCGAHWPIVTEATLAEFYSAAGVPTRIHNNCSGKHAAFLCACAHKGLDAEHYTDPDHPLQTEIRTIIETLIGRTIGAEHIAIDGCSAPNFAMSLEELATAFWRALFDHHTPREIRDAVARLLQASMAFPYFMSGDGRFCKSVIEGTERAFYAKVGADGVYVAFHPKEKAVFAVKCDDGDRGASEVFLSRLVQNCFPIDEMPSTFFLKHSRRAILDYNGRQSGWLEAASL